jgi:hypothetical protein
MAGSTMTAIGTAQAKLSASTSMAPPTHHRPATKYPKPNHQPTAKAGRRRRRNRAGRSTVAPSSSHTRTGKEMKQTAKKS